MYSAKVVALRKEKFEAALGIKLIEYSVKYCEEMTERLKSCRDANDEEIRKPTPEEKKFIQNELYMTKLSFLYWAERYAIISDKGIGLKSMFPLRTGQELLIAEMGRLEEDTVFNGREDGVLIALLKARQFGGSTLAQAALVHRTTTQNDINGLTASDVPSSTGKLFAMCGRFLDNLPWWLRPNTIRRTTTFPQETGIQNLPTSKYLKYED